MNNTLKNALAFLGGAAIGSLVTYYFVKEKYEKIANDEIEQYKAELAEAREYLKLNKDEEEAALEEIEKYREITAKYDYNGIDESVYETLGNDKYVIAPENFGGEDDEYEQVSLTYYADDILTDIAGNIIDNVDELIGKESLNTFGEYEDDSVYVRNETLGIDYEILRDLRNYSDMDFVDGDE